MYNAFFWIGYPAYRSSIADVKPIRLLENLSTTSVDMLYFVGLENRVTICKSIPIFNRNLVT